jgi:hypothetical protein
MGGIKPHSNFMGICVGFERTLKEHTVGFECYPGLFKCLKSQMGYQQVSSKQSNKTNVHGKHTLYTSIATTHSELSTLT